MMPEQQLDQNAVGFLFALARDYIDKASVRCRDCQFPVWSLVDFSKQKRVIDELCGGCQTPVCLICGCTEMKPCAIKCAEGQWLPCAWAAPAVCTHCFWKMAEHAYRKVCAAEFVQEVSDHLTRSGAFDLVQ